MSRDAAASTMDLADFEPATESFRRLVVAGLERRQKTLPTQFLYDERGSKLFDQICELPEYYPTRTELAIMTEHVAEMAASLGPRVELVEYGSGSSMKTRRLLAALEDPAAYVPVDISREHLLAAAEGLDREFPGLEVLPVCADFTRPFEVPTPSHPTDRRAVYFPGSTIGNFEPEAAQTLLRHMADECGPGGAILIGVDLVKDPEILRRAYDDAAGVTAAFDLNLLRRINRELGADFDLGAFEHRAAWDAEHHRIEMQLVSLRQQTVHVGDASFEFAAGEWIHTEYSHKHTLASFAAVARRAGLEVGRVWTDEREWFSVQLLTVR